MNSAALRFKSRSRWGYGLMLTATLAGCASATAGKLAPEKELPVAVDPAASRAVQAVSLQSAEPDGQASWLIQPDVPRIPKVAGLDEQLPPHIQQRLSTAFDLAQRGATYSAAAEFQSVLGLCALELDSRDGGTSHRDALRQGLVALEEADEFSGEQLDWHESADVRSIAAGHATPVLHQSPQTSVDSIQAVQAYYAFAEERLSYACGKLPASSLAFYGLGRTIVVPDTHVAHAAGKATLYHRVALNVAPKNVLAGNELGVLLAQHGRLDEAEKVFQQCVALNGGPETRQNLLAVYAQKGEQHSSQGVVTAGQVPAADNAGPAMSSAGAEPATQWATPAAQANETGARTGYLERFRFLSKLPGGFRK